MGRSRGIAPLIGAALAAATLSAGLASTAGGAGPAEPSCRVGSAELWVDSPGADLSIAREGRRVVPRIGRHEIECSGPPATIDNIDRVYAKGGDAITLDLTGGPLAPGASPEPDGSDEIEVRLVTLEPTILLDDQPHHVVLAEADDDAVVDLDYGGGEGEADVRVPIPTPFKADITLRAGSGDDVINARGRGFDLALRQDLAAFGGPGDDKLAASSEGWGVLVAGGPGDDRLAGGRATDFVVGGRGDDRLRAGRGPDWVIPGDGRDRADCGRGRDIATKDSGDRLRRCEDVLRRAAAQDAVAAIGESARTGITRSPARSR